MKKSFPLPQYVKTALRLLNDSGYEAWVVGGAVRSLMLGVEVHDYDITTSALPDETEAVFKDYKVVETGIKHGTVTVIISRSPIEITTYRTESGYGDHRHPDQVQFTRTLEDDCARRDFTINAICYNPKEGIKDFYGGQMDLQNFLIRAIGDPEKRFDEDALRILRAVRLAAQLGFEIEPATRKAILDHYQDLDYVSAERLNNELYKTLASPYFRSVLHEYRLVFEELLPELQELDNAQWEGVEFNISNSPSDPTVRMALLLDSLHDPVRAEQVLRRLKYSNEFIYGVIDLLKNSGLPMQTRIDYRWILNKINVPFKTYISFRTSVNPNLSRSDAMEMYEKIIRDNDCCTIKQMAIKGTDLKKIGLKGPAISIGMNMCLQEIIEGRLRNDKEVLMNYLKSMRAKK